MHVLLDDDLGRLTLRRLRPWHRMLARGLADRLDRQLADGVRPEANAVLAARAMLLTSAAHRRALAASLQRMLAASVATQGQAQVRTRPRLVAARSSAGVAWPPHMLGRPDLIATSAAELAGLAGSLAEPGPVPARGVAMVSQLLADGGGPLYRAGCPGDLSAVIARASRALTS
jgi:hypothetical protein